MGNLARTALPRDPARQPVDAIREGVEGPDLEADQGFCQGSRQQAEPVLSDVRRCPVTRLARWPAWSLFSGVGGVCGNRRARVDGDGNEGGESCAGRRKRDRTEPLISGT
jgi:hypothetical protein